LFPRAPDAAAVVVDAARVRLPGAAAAAAVAWHSTSGLFFNGGASSRASRPAQPG